MRNLNRIKTFRDFLEKRGLDGLLVSTPANIFYASGFHGLSPLEREAYCFITKKHAYFITSALYAGGTSQKDFTLEIVSGRISLTKILEKIVAREKIATIGFEDSNITVLEYKKFNKIRVKWNPVDMYEIRKEKDTKEIAYIAKACKIGDNVFSYITSQIKPGMTEKRVASLMEIEMMRMGVTPSFPTIVAFGKNAAVPHHQTGIDVLEKNQFVLLDFGVQHNGYCSDMTRTIFVGKPTEKDKNIYETVRIAQEKAVVYIADKQKEITKKKNSLTPNVSLNARDVDKVARDYIIAQGFEGFPHSLGHGIGIEVHESPSLSPFSNDLLSEGMVFSIEPGIYLDGNLGVRIEDLFTTTIQNNKLIQLTKSSAELIIL